jgi:hypothetical protein
MLGERAQVRRLLDGKGKSNTSMYSTGVSMYAVELQNLVKGILRVGLLVVLILCAVTSKASAASRLITVECEDPQGITVYGGKPEIAERFGSAPKFILDTSDPMQMTVFWGSYVSPRLPEQFVDKFGLRPSAVKATIMFRNEDQITATRTDQQGLYVYTLYPKLEIGVFSAHRHWTTGETAANMYYGRCKFIQ